MTVAEALGVTAENASRFTAFVVSEDRLYWHMSLEHRLMCVNEEDGAL